MNGQDFTFNQVPGEVFSSFFEGAGEITQMLAYFEAHTYMGENAEEQIQLAKEIATADFVSLNDWIKLKAN